ncbi:hypothetical protein [Thermus brockianus]
MGTADPATYPLLRSQTALLAQALRLVARDGYRFWAYQTTPTERILQAVRKLDERHAVLLDPQARAVRRRARLPVAHLLLAPLTAMPPDNPRSTWPMLLLADQPLEGENLHRVELSPDPKRPLYWVAWRDGEWGATYILRVDKRGRVTWFLEEAFYRELLEEALLYATRGDWPRLVTHLKAMGHLPMFSGVWSQLQEIRRRVHQVWGDRHLRDPEGRWKKPPWGAALEGWPRVPLSPVGMRLYPEEAPRTLGEWWEMHRKGGA